MVVEVNEHSGWPLGLENMNMRLRVSETVQASTAPSNYFSLRKASFSSFSSSDLDTQSTRSFFQDHSISLGKLIGIKPGEGDLSFTNSIHPKVQDQVPMVNSTSDATKRDDTTLCHGICIPLLLAILLKINPNHNQKGKKKITSNRNGLGCSNRYPNW